MCSRLRSSKGKGDHDEISRHRLLEHHIALWCVPVDMWLMPWLVGSCRCCCFQEGTTRSNKERESCWVWSRYGVIQKKLDEATVNKVATHTLIFYLLSLVCCSEAAKKNPWWVIKVRAIRTSYCVTHCSHGCMLLKNPEAATEKA